MASSSRQAAADREAAVKGEALINAAEAGNINEVIRLLGKKADINYVHRFVVEGKEYALTPLSAAVREGHAEVAKFLITRKANVNLAEPCNGWTALHATSAQGTVPMIELLISKGAKHDVRNELGKTPLHVAAINCHEEAVACLLDHAADINAADEDGFTSLHHAAAKGIIPVIQLLISKGAKHDVRNKEGWTPLQLAAVNGHKEAVICLLDHGAYINAVNVHGFSALHEAGGEGHLEIVKLLVLKGADMTGEARGLTALEGAALKGHEKVVDFLIKSSARFIETGTVTRICKACGETNTDLIHMFCTGCMVIHYCSVECQKSDWQNHKPQCLSTREMREKYMSEGIKDEMKAKFEKFKIEEAKSGARFNETGTAANWVCKYCKVCKYCGQVDSVNMMRCMGCMSIHYCSVECQKSDWQNHKPQCLSIRAMREKYMDEGIKDELEEFHKFQTEEQKVEGAGPSTSSLNN